MSASEQAGPIRSALPYQIFQRNHSWYIRFSIQGQGQTVKALKTRNQHEAGTKAFEVYAEHKHRAKIGLVHQPRTVAWCVEEYLRRLETDVTNGKLKVPLQRQMAAVLTRYIAGYWPDTPLSQVSTRHMDAYWDWRRSYWSKGPGKDIKLVTYMRSGRQIRLPVSSRSRVGPSVSSQRTEAVIMRQFFAWAAKQGHTQTPP